jgi:hypothetical protein
MARRWMTSPPRSITRVALPGCADRSRAVSTGKILPSRPASGPARQGTAREVSMRASMNKTSAAGPP